MKTITIPDGTPMGIAGKGHSIALAIFLDDADEAIELNMTLETAKSLVSNLYRAFLEIKSREDTT